MINEATEVVATEAAGNAPARSDRLTVLRQQLEQKQEELELKMCQKALESADLLSNYVDPKSMLDDDGGQWRFLGAGDGKNGSSCAVFATEEELADARNECRTLAASNQYAICGHENRISYIVGTGHTYDVVAIKGETVSPEELAGLQAAVDDFTGANDYSAGYNRWCHRQTETLRRYDRDGEVFRRLFELPDGTIEVRFIEPEDVSQPTDKPGRQYAMGIERDPEDAETTLKYWVKEYNGDGSVSWEDIDADQVQHLKANVDSNVLRGCPTFWPIRKMLRGAVQVLFNIEVTSKIQTAIAMIRRHMGGTQAGASTLQRTGADYTRTNTVTGKTEAFKRYTPGTIIDAAQSTEYDFPAAGINVASYVAGVDAILRSCAARVVMPEFMFTANASNANFASTMVAEGPAIKMFQRLQATLKEADLEIIWKVLYKKFSKDLLARVEIQVGMPTLEVRDRVQESQINSILHSSGLMSPQTWAMREGLDYDQEQANWKAHRAANPEPDSTKDDPIAALQKAAAEAQAALWKRGAAVTE